VGALPYSVADRNFHKESGHWCVSPKSGGPESRVLLQSTEGDFIGTFTTHPQSPSAGTFEMALFDPKLATLDYFDLTFPGGGAAPKVTKNPDQCMTCHGGRDGAINYRMDPYRLWAYSTPFNEDLLRPGSVEAEWYLSFLDRIAAGEPVLRQLQPINDKQSIVDGLKEGPYQLKAVPAQVDFSATDSPVLNFTHQILEKNGCRIAASLARRPDFDKIKYAAVGGLIDCGNINEFFPEGGAYTQQSANGFFEQMRMGLKNGRFDLDSMMGETQAKHIRLIADRLSRRFDHFTQYAGEEPATEEIKQAVVQAPVEERYGVTNYETYWSHITKTRYLLEPLGVDVANWSMSVDPEFDSHVEFLYPAAQQPVFLDMLKKEFDLDKRVGRSIDLNECNNMGTKDGKQELSKACKTDIYAQKPMLCTELAQKSRAALKDFQPKADRFASAMIDSKDDLENDARALADKSSLSDLTAQAGQIYGSICYGCHRGAYNQGAWFYPFENMDEMNRLLKREKTAGIHVLDGQRLGREGTAKGDWLFDYVSPGDRIWDRVTRHPRMHGTMPRFTPTGLKRDDKVTLRAHMLKVWDSP
jgi:hypothetical protein